MNEAYPLRRGEIWNVAGGTDYAGTPRPVVIEQDDRFDATDSITICAVTTDEADAPLFRLPVQPNARDGQPAACRLMVDKITTVPKTKIGARIAVWTTRISCGSTRPFWSSLGWLFRREPRRQPDEFRVPSSVSIWRRGWDSNPRYGLTYNGFRDRPDRPLRHPSWSSLRQAIHAPPPARGL